MRKFAFIALLAILAFCFTSVAYAGTLKPGGKTTCTNAGSITLEVSGTSADRSNGNAVIWKSSTATTHAITLGPGADQGFAGARKVGMANKHNMGRNKVVLGHQNNFSRGDSIGDISGEVRITNTGTNTLKITCG